MFTIDEYKEYLPANTIDESKSFEAFEKIALLKHLQRYLGKTLTVNLLGESPDSSLLAAIKPAWINLTYLESIPYFNLVLTSTGYGVVSNTNIAPASMDRVRELKDACLQTANEGINQLLIYLELANPEGWNRCSINSGSLIPDTDTFNSITGMDLKHHTFMEMIPFARHIENVVLANAFSLEFITDLASREELNVKPMIQKALAYFSFDMLLAKSQGMPDVKNSPVIGQYKKMAIDSKQRALAYLETNHASYPVYEQYGYEAPYDNASDDNESSFFIGGYTA